jgi:predicted  nucleic acid-binding Zn-ribbon protein
MSYARNLHQLQQLELDIEVLQSNHNAVNARLKDRSALDEANTRLDITRHCLDELKKKQHTLDWEIEDISIKLETESKTLYSGRIKNPKELSSLQHDAESLKSRKDGLEEVALELMEQVEQAETNMVLRSRELKKLEEEQIVKESELSAELRKLNISLAEIETKHQQTIDEIDRADIDLYGELKKQKGRAVAVVEQGVCRGCGLSLSSAWLQRARGNALVRCTSCGRILFLE